MTFKPFTPIIAAALSALILAGCSNQPQPTVASGQFANRDFNFLGFVNEKPDSYAETPAWSPTVHTNELVARSNYSGDQTTLFWGAITIDDY